VNLAISGINSYNGIVMPAGMNSVVKAVNVAGLADSTVNGITFQADTAPWVGGAMAAHNGYSTDCGKNDMPGLTGTAGSYSGADFTTTTLNVGQLSYGTTGIFGNIFTGLTPNTEYVFDVFFTEQHAGRGARFGYAIGGSGIRYSTYSLGYGAVNRVRLTFNTGTATTFDWLVDNICDPNNGLCSGFALYSALPAAAPDAFGSWIANMGFPGALATDDSDQDGVPNGIEYALGGESNPSEPNWNSLGLLPKATQDGANLVFTFQHALASKTAGTECAIEVGTSLDAWPQVYVVGTAPEAVVSAGLTDGFETVTLTLPREPDAAKFARLRVTVTP